MINRASTPEDRELLKRIDSRQNRKIRFYKQLDKREVRSSSGIFAAEGLRLIIEVLSSPLEVPEIYLSETLDRSVLDKIKNLSGSADNNCNTSIYIVPEKLFRAMAHTDNPQGLAAVVRQPGDKRTIDCIDGWSKVVLLYHPRDPGNTGTIMRTAEAAGFHGVILIEPACDPFNPKAVRASMGSIFRLPVLQARSLEEVVGRMSNLGFQLLIANQRSPKNLYEIEIRKPLGIIFGGETCGLPPIKKPSLTEFSLPMSEKVESLNLAQAVTAVLYEIKRRELAGSRHNVSR